jgi:hypothetical protein
MKEQSRRVVIRLEQTKNSQNSFCSFGEETHREVLITHLSQEQPRDEQAEEEIDHKEDLVSKNIERLVHMHQKYFGDSAHKSVEDLQRDLYCVNNDFARLEVHL